MALLDADSKEQYCAWREKPSAKINVEIRNLLRNPSAEDKVNLRSLSPDVLGRSQEGDL